MQRQDGSAVGAGVLPSGSSQMDQMYQRAARLHTQNGVDRCTPSIPGKDICQSQGGVDIACGK